MEQRETIKQWKEDERPREKLLSKGSTVLSDAELLAILLRVGGRGKTAIDLAKEVLRRADNSLVSLSKMSIDALSQIKGVGKVKAITVSAIFELSQRLLLESPKESQQISSSEMIYKIMAPKLKDLLYEECWAIYLNKANKIIAKERVSIGGVASTVVDIRIIMKKAIEKLASAIILVHNHPSGNISPSLQDKEQTRKLKESCGFMDITLLDHIIIAANKYFSFADESII